MNKKIKIIVFVLLIISFAIVIFLGIFGTSLSFLSSEEIKENRKNKENLINNLKINNIDTVYDKNNNIYYYMVTEDYKNKNYVFNLSFEKDLKYKIVGETLNIVKVDYNKPIKIIIYDDKHYYETKIQLTNLPLINIQVEEEIALNDANSIFTYINSNNAETKVEKNSKIHVRGATSKYFDKKSYKINIYDKKYEDEKEINISQFYYGNSFVLDAVYRDSSKVRNLLATQLWNDISNDFTNVDIYSEFVEVFINNEYIGLYIMTEPINRRKLNLNKSSDNDTSIVIKAQDWGSITSDMDFSDIENDIHLNFELKYPNDESLYSASWEKILTKMASYYDLTSKSSYEIINSTFNINNYIDMLVFNAFINNSDNRMIKNNYFYMKSLEDNEIYIQPWDMEYIFGTRYKNSSERNTLKDMEDYKTIYTQFEHDSVVINKLLINRYWELRKNILTKEYFDKLLDEYISKLTKGAAKRDSDKWYEYDVEQEIEEIRTWLYNRLEFFDEYVESLENE